jgi:hypothetical protein
MARRPILLRNYSKESEETERILSESGIEYARFFDTQAGRPCIVSSHGTYEGEEGAKRFLRVVRNGTP